MITESSLQPLLALIFLLCGAVAYLPMIIIGWLPMSIRLPVLKHIIEGVWGLFFCIVFAGAAHLFYDGRIKYFTVICYLGGAAMSAFFLKLPIQTLARKIYAKRKKKKEVREAEIKKANHAAQN